MSMKIITSSIAPLFTILGYLCLTLILGCGKEQITIDDDTPHSDILNDTYETVFNPYVPTRSIHNYFDVDLDGFPAWNNPEPIKSKVGRFLKEDMAFRKERVFKIFDKAKESFQFITKHKKYYNAYHRNGVLENRKVISWPSEAKKYAIVNSSTQGCPYDYDLMLFLRRDYDLFYRKGDDIFIACLDANLNIKYFLHHDGTYFSKTEDTSYYQLKIIYGDLMASVRKSSAPSSEYEFWDIWISDWDSDEYLHFCPMSTVEDWIIIPERYSSSCFTGSYYTYSPNGKYENYRRYHHLGDGEFRYYIRDPAPNIRYFESKIDKESHGIDNEFVRKRFEYLKPKVVEAEKVVSSKVKQYNILINALIERHIGSKNDASK